MFLQPRGDHPAMVVRSVAWSARCLTAGGGESHVPVVRPISRLFLPPSTRERDKMSREGDEDPMQKREEESRSLAILFALASLKKSSAVPPRDFTTVGRKPVFNASKSSGFERNTAFTAANDRRHAAPMPRNYKRDICMY